MDLSDTRAIMQLVMNVRHKGRTRIPDQSNNLSGRDHITSSHLQAVLPHVINYTELARIMPDYYVIAPAALPRTAVPVVLGANLVVIRLAIVHGDYNSTALRWR